MVVVEAETGQRFDNVLPLDRVSAGFHSFVVGFTGDEKDELSDELLDSFHAFLGDFGLFSLFSNGVLGITHAISWVLIVCTSVKSIDDAPAHHLLFSSGHRFTSSPLLTATTSTGLARVKCGIHDVADVLEWEKAILILQKVLVGVILCLPGRLACWFFVILLLRHFLFNLQLFRINTKRKFES